MKDPKNFSLLLIPYLTICGALYHMAYWDTFNLNGLSFISLGDIIKSSVYPVISTFFFLYLGVFIGNLYNPLEKFFPKGEGQATSLGKKLNSKPGLAISFTLWAITIFLLTKLENPHRWISIGFLVAFVPFIFFNRINWLRNIFATEKTRETVIEILVLLPTLSFCIGKFNREMIQKNFKYKYSKIKSTSLNQTWQSIDTVKLLGSTDKHYIFSDLKNSIILFIKTENTDTLILKDKE